MRSTATLCASAALARGSRQVEVGAVVASGSLGLDLILEALDESILLLQLLGQSRRRSQADISV